jgi:hypothetical protein
MSTELAHAHRADAPIVSWPASPPMPPVAVVLPEPDLLPPGWVKVRLRRGGIDLLDVGHIDAVIPNGVGGGYDGSCEITSDGVATNVELSADALLAHVAAAEGGLNGWLRVPLLNGREGFVRATRIYRISVTRRQNFEVMEAGQSNNRATYDLCLPLGAVVRIPEAALPGVCRVLTEVLASLPPANGEGRHVG